MIAGLLQMAAFLGTAWLLSVAVDSCYRRNEPADGAPPVEARAPRPLPAPPARAPLPAVPASGVRRAPTRYALTSA